MLLVMEITFFGGFNSLKYFAVANLKRFITVCVFPFSILGAEKEKKQQKERNGVFFPAFHTRKHTLIGISHG